MERLTQNKFFYEQRNDQNKLSTQFLWGKTRKEIESVQKKTVAKMLMNAHNFFFINIYARFFLISAKDFKLFVASRKKNLFAAFFLLL